MVIATVFLTIMGLTGGFVLGERRRDEDKAAEAAAARQSQPALATQPTAPAPEGPLCPAETRETAIELGLPDDLRQTLKIETDNGTVVWICQDPAGRLYYQGKTGGPQTTLVQHRNGLFLPDVERRDTDDYEVTDPKGNIILIDRERLELRFATGRRERHEVVSAR
nr:hypothetical protein [uncultured Actinoplanes sp.]